MRQTRLDPAAEQAIDWMVKLRAGRTSQAQQARFEQWLHSDAAHADAWATLQHSLGQPYDTLRQLNNRLPSGTAQELLLQPSSSRRNLLRGLAAFGLFGGATWLGARSQPGQALLADFSTGTGERRHLQLSDGSGLDLNASSAIDLRFSSRQRLLLLRHGELVVQVAADAGRPFIVRSAQGSVQALGTRFLVRQEADATRVVVLEHSVRLSLANGTQRVLLQGHGALLRGDRIDLLTGEQSYQADWLNGRLSVLDAPLGDVIEALRPYRRGLIRVSPQIRQLRVQGVFPLDDTQRSLAALAETLPISVDHYGPWLTLLGPKNQ